jgi:glycosyltransferase involved in cell wall biosynthesis
MFNDKRVSVLVPCLNEKQGLGSVLGTLPDFIDEVIVVDNGSTDGSRETAEKYRAKLLIEKTKGYGKAILTGLRNVTCATVIIMDGDGSYGTKDIPEILFSMERDGADFISGCRFPLNASGVMPVTHILSNYFISWLTRFVFRIDVRDIQSGMMVFKRDILEKIKPHNTGMGFSQEIKIKAWSHRRLRCKETHISLQRRLGKPKFRKIRDGLGNLIDLLRLKFRMG